MKYLFNGIAIIIILFFGILLECPVYATDNLILTNFKVITGENIQKNQNEYRIIYYSNENSICISFDINNENEYTEKQIKEAADQISIIGDDNTVAGQISYNQGLCMKINLHEGENKINIRNNDDNKTVLRLSIIYEKVNIKGIPENIKAGDRFNLTWNMDKCDSCKINTEWYSYGIDTMLLSKNGKAVIVNGGKGNAAAMLYDQQNNPIGHIEISITAIGNGNYGWIKNDDKWYYIDPVTKCFKIGWITSNNNIYYINPTGDMATGWIEDKGKRYYMNDDGTLTIGWKKIQDRWYYFNNDGSMTKGWINYKNKKYYFGEDGVMISGSMYIEGKIYTFAENGELITTFI